MARLIQAKKLSAREAVAAHLKQIERVNPKVNAIVTLVAEMAGAAALKADEMQARKEKLGPLHGLPVAHKDLLETRGIRTTYGSPLYKDYIPTEDDIVVERMRRAGAIIIGKTNTPEFGAGSQTFNTVFGATRNPYDLTKTCGGSSGGAAVALACGLTPVASGSDTGGSLRNPAAFCNIVGFRPSIGRVPNPKAAFAWSTLSTSGCLGRSAADLAFALSTIAGPDSRDAAFHQRTRRTIQPSARPQLQRRPRRLVQGSWRRSLRLESAHDRRWTSQDIRGAGMHRRTGGAGLCARRDRLSDASRMEQRQYLSRPACRNIPMHSRTL